VPATNTAAPALLMPAEWERHEGTWIAWPHNREDWPGRFEPIPWAYCEIVRRLAEGETVNICVQSAKLRADAEDKLRRAGANLKRVRFHDFKTDRVWTRDSGPIFVRESGTGSLGVVCSRFNGWAKYDNWKRDVKLPYFVKETLGIGRAYEHTVATPNGPDRMVLEGGSIDVNGAGTMLTTEECLLSKVQERNPGLKRKDYEAAFGKLFGIRHTVWLGKGIAGDDTHGHVDDLARFVNPTTVVLVQEKNEKDPNFKPLRENLERLQSATDQDGRKLTVVPLPMPEPVVFEKQRLPASYANFYIANGVVLVPTFNDPADRVALGTLAELFPDRKVIGIFCGDFVWGLGTIHCATQQQPAV
jgi:agmatine deiminase